MASKPVGSGSWLPFVLTSCFLVLLVAGITQAQGVLSLRAFAFAISSAYCLFLLSLQRAMWFPPSTSPYYTSTFFTLSMTLTPLTYYMIFKNCPFTPTGIKAEWKQRFLCILFPAISLAHETVPDIEQVCSK